MKATAIRLAAGWAAVRPLAATASRVLAVATSACALLVMPAAAHDTWWAPLDTRAAASATPRLALGTGERFPAQTIPLAASALRLQGCRGASGQPVALREVAATATAWVAQPAAPASTCWAQTLPLDIEIDDPLVEVYLNEIQAGPALRQRWAAMKAAGQRWREQYTKHARIDLDGPSANAPQATEAVPGLGLDVRLEAPRSPLRAGDTVRLQVLRDGAPLAGLPVEWRSDLSPLGLWQRTDAGGWVSLRLPLAARWVLRGVDLREPAAAGEPWTSRFVTLAFEVQPGAR